MSNWKSLLRGNPIDWLLEEDNPSVRYYTLTDILGRPECDFLVCEAKNRIMKIGVVPKILDKQKSEGYWDDPQRFYLSVKYRGTAWTFVILTALGASSEDKRIKKTCEYILENSQERQSGGFAIRGTKHGGGDHSAIEPCHTGNMLWCLIKNGFLDDDRVKCGLDWVIKYQRFDDGVESPPVGWPYNGWEMCWGKHTCHMGVVKTLKALAEIPSDRRSHAIRDKIEEAVEYFLMHHIYKRSHDLTRVSRSEFTKFGFPRLYDTDALEILDILTKLDCKDKRMQEAIGLVISKQDEQGRWKLESTWNGRIQATIEQKDKPSKWVTLHALRILKRLYS
jgi:hypothetical protein